MKISQGNHNRLHSWMLVATFFSLWLAVYLSTAMEEYLAYVLIFTFGILHGSNDLKLLAKTGQTASHSFNHVRTLIYYVVFVLGMALLFYSLPSVALLVFILISGYHFGEQHLGAKTVTASLVSEVCYLLYGLLILFLLFRAHQEKVIEVVSGITAYQLPASLFGWVLISAFAIIVLLYAIYFKHFKLNILIEVFQLGVFYIVFETASLLWAFAIYFIIWHSIPSLADQLRYIYGSVSKGHFLKYLKSAALYWVMAMFILAGLFLFLKDSLVDFLPIFFAFLAAITFPHVLVIRRLNGS